MLIGAAWLLLACGEGAPEPGTAEAFAERPTNVLVLVLDDVGTDQLSCYAEHPEAPATPQLDRLADWGVRFTNAYSAPVCSPARAALLTGRSGRRTGVGDIVSPTGRFAVADAERFLPERLPPEWSTLAAGKWHLAGTAAPDWASHALRQGFSAQRGTPGNLGDRYGDSDGRLGYTRWEQLDDGELTVSEGYATTRTVDDTLAWVEGASEPWLAVVSFHAAHGPYEPPPDSLLDGAGVDADAPVPERYAAIVRAMDAEIGRLVDALPAEVLQRTMIVALGDNGTPGEAVLPPWDGTAAKGTLLEGGVGVPLIIAGAGVSQPGRTSDALAHVLDILPTVLEGVGEELPDDLDGVSLVPVLADPAAAPRDVVISEMFGPNGRPPYAAEGFAVRDARYKLYELRLPGEPVDTRLFDLRGRTDDGPDLLDGPLDAEAEAALERLRAELEAWRAIPFEGG